LGSCFVESSKNDKLDGKKKTLQPSFDDERRFTEIIIAGWVGRVGMPSESFSTYHS